MNLEVGNIVEFREGGRGVVVGWTNNTPAYVVGARFTNPVKKWGEDGHFNSMAEKSRYDIIKVYSGTEIENPVTAFRASIKLENFPLLWEEKE